MKKRSIEILNRLILSDTPVSNEILSEEYNVSQRTIRNEIAEINKELSENKLPTIKNVRSKGYILSYSDEEYLLLKELMKESSELDYFLEKDSRLLDIILSIAFDSERITLSQKEIEYQISKSSLDDDMRRIKTYLHQYDVSINSSYKDGLEFLGSEKKILIMLFELISKFSSETGYINYFNDMKNISPILTNHIDTITFSKIISAFDKNFNEILDENYRNSIILITSIWVQRLLKKRLLKDYKEYKEGFVYFKCNQNIEPSMKNYILSIIKSFGISPSELEMNILIQLIDIILPTTLEETIDWSSVQIITLQLMQFVQNETGIDYTSPSIKFHEGLYKHMGALLKRLKNGVQFNNPLTENIKKKSPIIYSAISNFFKENENFFGSKITDDEIAYLTIYFSTIESELRQQGNYYYKIAVICNHGKATGSLLAESLKEYFNVEVVAILSSSELYILEKLDIDLVFSTFPINFKSKPLLIIDPIIRDNNKQLIKSFLSNHIGRRRFITTEKVDVNNFFHSILNCFEEENIQVDSKIYEKIKIIFSDNNLFVNDEEIRPLIKDVLTEDKVLLNITANDWEDSIRKVSYPLLEGGDITEEYVEAMISSIIEYGPYIVIGDGIALAHARPEDGVKSIGLSLATLNPPVRFGHETNDPVRLIFCLSAVDSFSHLNIMKELVNFMQSPNKIKEVINAKNKQDVINIIEF